MKGKLKQTCIFIVGMHRSGTSAVTGTLKLMGVELGSELMRPWPDNPKGFFENNKIWKYNQKILEKFGSSWDDPFLYGEDWVLRHDLSSCISHIKKLMGEEFSASPLFGIKDPRMCILFPLWKEVCEQKQITTLCILPFRHPLEVARSLRKRNGFSIEMGLLLWMNYVLTSESVTRGERRVFWEFNDLFSNLQGLLDYTAANLGIRFPKVYAEVSAELEPFMDRELKHHSTSNPGKTRVEIIAGELYALFCRAAESGERELIWNTEVEKLRKEYGELISFFLNSDLQKHYGSQQVLLNLEKRIERLKKDNKNLKTTQSMLENEIEVICNTKTWRLAEKLRRFSGYKNLGKE